MKYSDLSFLHRGRNAPQSALWDDIEDRIKKLASPQFIRDCLHVVQESGREGLAQYMADRTHACVSECPELLPVAKAIAMENVETFARSVSRAVTDEDSGYRPFSQSRIRECERQVAWMNGLSGRGKPRFPLCARFDAICDRSAFQSFLPGIRLAQGAKILHMARNLLASGLVSDDNPCCLNVRTLHLMHPHLAVPKSIYDPSLVWPITFASGQDLNDFMAQADSDFMPQVSHVSEPCGKGRKTAFCDLDRKIILAMEGIRSNFDRAHLFNVARDMSLMGITNGSFSLSDLEGILSAGLWNRDDMDPSIFLESAKYLSLFEGMPVPENPYVLVDNKASLAPDLVAGIKYLHDQMVKEILLSFRNSADFALETLHNKMGCEQPPQPQM